MSDIERMFDDISDKYDFLNDLISLYLHKIVKRIAISELSIKKEDKILDLCTGTGDLAGIIKNKNPKATVIGLDLSSKMLDIARTKHKNIEFIQGNAAKLPFLDNEFDFVVSAFGYRNIEDKDSALSELKRVLKDGGYFLQLDFGKSILTPFFDFLILFFAKIFSKKYDAYKYLVKSKNEFSAKDVVEEFKKAGFKPVKVKNLLFGIISYQIFIK